MPPDADPRLLAPSRRFWPVLERQLRVYRRTWRASVFGRLLSPVLLLLSVGLGLGALVDRGAGIVWNGRAVPYLLFVAPALLAAQAMTTGIGESSWPVLGAIRWNGTYHAMLATPIRTRDILTAHLCHVSLQVAGGAAVFLAVAGAFGAFPSWWVLAALPVAVLTGAAFAALMTAVAAWALHEAVFAVVFRLVLTPLLLFAGTFFPVDSLPTPLRPVAWFTPLWHGVEACRALALGDVTWAALAGHVGALGGFLAVGGVLAGRTLRSRLVT